MACGIFNSGSAVGAIVAPPLVAWIILTLGWPSAFAIVGCAGFLWLAFWWPTYRTPVAAVGEVAASAIPVRELLSTRFVIAFTVAKIFFDPVWYFYIFWFPEYLKNARHFDLAAIGKYSWIPFAVAGAGNFAGGWLSAFLLRRGLSASAARKGATTFFMCLMMAAIPAVLAPEAWQSIALVSVAMMGYTGGLANMLAMPADVFPKEAVASVFGLASMGSGLRRDGFHADHRVGCGPLFVYTGIYRVRVCAVDRGRDFVERDGAFAAAEFSAGLACAPESLRVD